MVLKNCNIFFLFSGIFIYSMEANTVPQYASLRSISWWLHLPMDVLKFLILVRQGFQCSWMIGCLIICLICPLISNSQSFWNPLLAPFPCPYSDHAGTQKVVGEIREARPITSLSSHDAGRYLLTTSADFAGSLWDLQTLNKKRSLAGASGIGLKEVL